MVWSRKSWFEKELHELELFDNKDVQRKQLYFHISHVISKHWCFQKPRSMDYNFLRMLLAINQTKQRNLSKIQELLVYHFWYICWKSKVSLKRHTSTLFPNQELGDTLENRCTNANNFVEWLNKEDDLPKYDTISNLHIDVSNWDFEEETKSIIWKLDYMLLRNQPEVFLRKVSWEDNYE